MCTVLSALVAPATAVPVVQPPSSKTPHVALVSRGNGPLPACTFTNVVADIQGENAQHTVLDSQLRLPHGWKPSQLERLSGGHRLQPAAAAAWRAMQHAAAASGIRLVIVSAYRSDSYQSVVFNRAIRRHGRTRAMQYVARPGHSEHQLGLTVDLGVAVGVALHKEPVSHPPTSRSERTANWLRDHAATFGWVRSYPLGATAKTCYGAEPWHWRYVGIQDALAVQSSALTLREYLWRLH